MNAIIVGHTCEIGQSIKRLLEDHGHTVHGWSRSNGLDVVTHEGCFPVPPCLGVVVHVAETGLIGLKNVWTAVRPALQQNYGVFVFISSIAAIQDAGPYADSKRAQEAYLQSVIACDWVSRIVIVRLGHVLGTKAWPEDTSSLCERRYIRPGDAAEAVLFCARCVGVRGAVITVDAGETTK